MIVSATTIQDVKTAFEFGKQRLSTIDRLAGKMRMAMRLYTEYFVKY